MQTIVKQPGEQIALPLTFGGISTIAALVSVDAVARGLVPGALPLTVNPNLFANAVTLTIAGGSADERYLITAIADATDGQRHEVEVEIACLDLAWIMPDGGAPMLSIDGFVSRFGLDEVVRMTDTRGDGRIDRQLLIAALTDAQAIAESYLGARYALPLDPVPVLVASAIADLARARLYGGTLPDGVAGAARAAEKTLERINSGQVTLPSAGPVAATASETPVNWHSGGRTYPDGLADY